MRSLGRDGINPHIRQSRFSEAERLRGLNRNVNDPASYERAPVNDPHDRAAAVVQIEDPDLRSHRQGAMRRDESLSSLLC